MNYHNLIKVIFLSCTFYKYEGFQNQVFGSFDTYTLKRASLPKHLVESHQEKGGVICCTHDIVSRHKQHTSGLNSKLPTLDNKADNSI